MHLYIDYGALAFYASRQLRSFNRKMEINEEEACTVSVT